MCFLFIYYKLPKGTYLCLHYPGRVDLHVSKSRPIAITVNKDVNLNWNEQVCIKHIPLVIQPMPVPVAFLEAKEDQ